MTLPEVDGLCRDHDPNPVRREHHELAANAHTTDAIRSAEAPDSRRITTAPVTISGRSKSAPLLHAASAKGPTISAANSTGSSGAGRTSRPVRASVRHEETWFAGTPCRRATSFTVTPGFRVSATIRAFTSSGHFRFRRLRPPTGRTSIPASMEKLRPDQHQAPISRLQPRQEGAVQETLTDGTQASR